MKNITESLYAILYIRILPNGENYLWYSTDIIETVGSDVRGILVDDIRDAKLYTTVESAVKTLRKFHNSDDYNAAIDNDYMYKDPVVVEIKTEKTYKVINKSKWSKVINREKINEIKEVIQNHQNTINNLKDIIERLSA